MPGRGRNSSGGSRASPYDTNKQHTILEWARGAHSSISTAGSAIVTSTQKLRVQDYNHDDEDEDYALDIQPLGKNWCLPRATLRRHFPQATMLQDNKGKHLNADFARNLFEISDKTKLYHVFYSDENKPIRLSKSANSMPFVREAISIANGIMTTRAFDMALLKFDNTPEFRAKVVELVPKIDIGFLDAKDPELKHCWAWTKDQLGDRNKQIYLTKYFTRCFESVDPGSLQWKTIVFFIAVCLVHEIGHLCMRWMNQKDTPTRFEEAGEYLEKAIFEGTVSAETVFKEPDNLSLDSNPIIIGVCISNNKDHRIKSDQIESFYDSLVIQRLRFGDLPVLDLEPFVEGETGDGQFKCKFKNVDEKKPARPQNTTPALSFQPNTVIYPIAHEPRRLNFDLSPENKDD